MIRVYRHALKLLAIAVTASVSSGNLLAADSFFPFADIEKTYWFGSGTIADARVSTNGSVRLLGNTLRITSVDSAGVLLSDGQLGSAFPYPLARLAADGSVFVHEGVGATGKQIAKYLPDARLAWRTNYSIAEVHALLPMADGGVFILVDQLKILRLDANGSLLWSKNIPLGADNGHWFSSYPVANTQMKAAAEGGYVIAGRTRPGEDLRVIRLDEAGEVLWDKVVGGPGLEEFGEIHSLASGEFLLGATAEQGTSATKTISGFGRQDIWVVKFDRFGTISSQSVLGGSSDDVFKSLAETQFGYAVLADSWSPANGVTKTAPVTGSAGEARNEWLMLLDEQLKLLVDESYPRESSYPERPAFLFAHADGTLLRFSYPHKPNIRRYRLNYSPEVQLSASNGGVLIGKRAQLSVGDYLVPNTSFQWFKNGALIPNGTNSTLVIPAFSENDAGSYLVSLTNRWGSASSEPVVLRTANVSYRAELVPSLLIEGEVGASYNIESSPTPDAPWSLEAQITLTNSPQRWLDLRNLTERQFYRVQKVQP